MASADTCLNCGQELRRDSNDCGVCGTPRHRSEPVGLSSADDPWGDRQIETEELARHAHSREDDRLAGMGTRTWATLMNFAIALFLPFAWFIWGPLTVWKYRRGQDIGASVFKIRVVRTDGEVAGFYHMWTRNLLASLGLLALGAGYWTAYFDENNRTWHDKIMGTYVIWDNSDAKHRPGTSSYGARVGFWISIPAGIALSIALTLAGVPV